MVEQIMHFPLKYLFVIQSSSVGVIFEHEFIGEPETEPQSFDVPFIGVIH